ncbi:hypothetical protein EJA00_06145 [Streptococcus suis]|uniref:DNA-entry nuclease n=1 Tax=Streptococcus suis TaxID=1307 RepID=A0A426T487_STRSU|nr:DNA/RNA non-specific endonuclease [Streptococcus suis]RRR48452.1 hypothetical protein EJA00_06145 [Streptococcus suis]
MKVLEIHEIKKLPEDKPIFEKKLIKNVEEEGETRSLYHALGMRILLTKVHKKRKKGVTDGHAVGKVYGRDFGPNSDFYHASHLLGEQIFPNKASYCRGEYIVGTRSLNMDCPRNDMKHYEEIVAKKLEGLSWGEKIYYTVIPDFKDEEAIARGVRMVAKSFNHNWESTITCNFDTYIKNEEPGYQIDYMTGKVEAI